MEAVILSPIPLEQLKAELTNIVRNELIQSHKQDLEEKLLAPSEACKLFQPKISKVTLANWTKDGKLTVHKLGGRIY